MPKHHDIDVLALLSMVSSKLGMEAEALEKLQTDLEPRWILKAAYVSEI